MIKIFYSYLLQSRIQQSRNPEATLRLESEIQVPLIKNPEPVPRIRNPQRGVHNPQQSWVTLQIWGDKKYTVKLFRAKILFWPAYMFYELTYLETLRAKYLKVV